MVVEGTISEATAVQQAGVSARTLQRFSEAGYLTVQVKGEGERYYSPAQLHEIFGSFQETETVSEETEAAAIIEECDATTSFGPSCSHDATTYYTPAEPTPVVERATPVAATESQTSAGSEKMQEDYAKLTNLVALQERILDMKDSEIQDLRSQRDWLKTRVEKLEEKGDRDQVLLLSETQALRQLIALQHKKPSTIRSLLDWLGLGSSEQVPALPSNQDIATTSASHNTIVMNKTANG
jgi:DNA-binding transcriptional MerR regulator